MTVTAQQKRDAIDAIAKSNGGIVEPDLVIQAARSPNHVLHPLFDWNEKRAAMEHWRDIARSIIREVEVRYTINRRVVTSIGYVRDPRAEGKQQGSIALSAVERKSEHARMIIESEMRIIEGRVERARDIAAVLGMERDLERLLADVVLIREKAAAE